LRFFFSPNHSNKYKVIHLSGEFAGEFNFTTNAC
jgi:hypothetical protein